MSAKELDKHWLTFIENSERLAHMSPANNGKIPGVKTYSPAAEAVAERTRKRMEEQRDAHLRIVQTVAGARRLMNPLHINEDLVGRSTGGGEVRGTADGHQLQRPNGPLVLYTLLEELMARIERFLESRAGFELDELDELFAWNMHVELHSLRVFREGNGRTARIYLNHIRALRGLPPFTFEGMTSAEYWAEVDQYRLEVLVPQWHERGIIE